MDHRRIDDQNVAELYVTGRLSPEDEETFESHLLECTECRERVGWADDLRTSIRAVAAEDAARASVQLGFLAWVSRHTRGARAGALMAALLAVAALPAWLQADRARLSRELAEARSELHAAAVRPAPPVPAPAPVAAPAAPAAPVDTAELERLEQEKSWLEQQLARLTGPQNARIIPLGTVRGDSELQPIELGPSPEWIVVSLDLPQLDDETSYETYRVTLLEGIEGRRTLSKQGGFVPSASDTLDIHLYSDLLKPGTAYRFLLEGIDAGGRAVHVGEIPFKAVKG